MLLCFFYNGLIGFLVFCITDGTILPLTANISPADASRQTPIWSSADANIASINGTTLTANNPGTVTITARAMDRNSSVLDTQIITVTKVDITAINITTATELIDGESSALTAEITPPTSSNQVLEWSIKSGEAFARIINNNAIFGLAPGQVTIVATSTDGTNVSSEKTLTVIASRFAPHAPTRLSAISTGVPNQVRVSWNLVDGSENYNLYQSTENLQDSENRAIEFLQFRHSGITPMSFATNTTVIDLPANQTAFFLVSSINNNRESVTNGAQLSIRPSAFAFAPLRYDGRVWLDRNLGANSVGTDVNDATSFGDYYQWGRPADGHEKRFSGVRNSGRADSITPNNNRFIASSSDWVTTADGVDLDISGAKRRTFWSKIDGFGICPVGFRVPNINELLSLTRDRRFDHLRAAGFRSGLNGQFDSPGSIFLWSIDTRGGEDATTLREEISGGGLGGFFRNRQVKRSVGMSVRCVADTSQASLPVPAFISVTNIDITNSNQALAGTTHELTAEVLPANAALGVLTWSIQGSSSIATVNGNILTARAAGEVIVVATATDGSNIQATQSFTVTPLPANPIAVSGIQITNFATHIKTSIHAMHQ
ncbi:MAG: hypothetical protein HAW58_06765, partial [Candidatus Thioglobus sp.]|nr:hypothetical protein [Candidatus Thioglobus sp.]